VGSLLFTCFRLIHFQALYPIPQSIGIAGGRPSSSYYFVGWIASRQPILPRPPSCAYSNPITLTPASSGTRAWDTDRQTTPERGSASPLGHNRSPTSPASSRTGSTTFSHRSPASLSPLSKQLSTSSSSSGGAHARWHSMGANGAESELSGAASDTNLDLTQTHYATAYSATELRTFHADRVRKMPLSGPYPSMLIGFLCKMRLIGLTFDRG
jgi:cysteine protease ATG4